MSQAWDTTQWHNDRPFAPAHRTGGDLETVCHATLLVACLAVLACAAALTPSENALTLFGARWPFSCRLHDTLGIQCALCGMSRSFTALAHGDLAAGAAFHRLGPIVFALSCLQIPYRLYALAIRPRRIGKRLAKLHVGLVVLLGLALFVNWIVYLGGLLL